MMSDAWAVCVYINKINGGIDGRLGNLHAECEEAYIIAPFREPTKPLFY